MRDAWQGGHQSVPPICVPSATRNRCHRFLYPQSSHLHLLTLLWSSTSPSPSSPVLAADLCPSPSFLAPLSPSFIRSIPLLSSSRSLSASVRRRSLCRRRDTRGRRRSHSSAASSLAGNERWRGSQRVERRRQHRGAPSPPSSSTSRVPMQSQPQETSSAYYILQQYTAASGGQELQNPIRNAYAMGKVRMVASEFETATRVVKIRNASRCAESGGFVLWQMKQKWAFCGNYSFQVWGDGNEPYQNKNGRGVDN
ncbi:Lipase [Arachis hypogaea]|nr:Lipase [Arachis hypogaea]